MTGALPEEFAALEPFACRWAGVTAYDRAALRDAAAPDAARAFYDAVLPLAAPALDHLDRTPLADHDEADQRMMRLLLAFAHVAMGIEVQAEDEPAHARLRPYMRLTRAPADEPGGTA